MGLLLPLFVRMSIHIEYKVSNSVNQNISFFFLGGLLPFTVYASLGFKQIPPVEENEQHEDSKVEA